MQLYIDIIKNPLHYEEMECIKAKRKYQYKNLQNAKKSNMIKLNPVFLVIVAVCQSNVAWSIKKVTNKIPVVASIGNVKPWPWNLKNCQSWLEQPTFEPRSPSSGNKLRGRVPIL